MKIIDKPFNSDKEWLQWRHKGIGASDVSVIMGASKYNTMLKLLNEKIQDEPKEQEYSFVAQKGIEVEPFARSWFYLKKKKKVHQAFCVHPEQEYFRASLDGLHYNKDKKKCFIWEHKLIGKSDYSNLLKGEVPDKFKYQIQFQFYVTGLNLCYLQFILWDHAAKNYDKTTVSVVKVKRDEAVIKEVAERAEKFWNNVKHLKAEKTRNKAQG